MPPILSIDLLAGCASLAFACLTVTVVPDLGELVDPAIASVFGLAALARWYTAPRMKAMP